jgi:hypothetical protein
VIRDLTELHASPLEVYGSLGGGVTESMTDSQNDVPSIEDRRTQHRLRAIIDELQAGMKQNREAIERIESRIQTIAKDIDELWISRP